MQCENSSCGCPHRKSRDLTPYYASALKCTEQHQRIAGTEIFYAIFCALRICWFQSIWSRLVFQSFQSRYNCSKVRYHRILQHQPALRALRLWRWWLLGCLEQGCASNQKRAAFARFDSAPANNDFICNGSTWDKRENTVGSVILLRLRGFIRMELSLKEFLTRQFECTLQHRLKMSASYVVSTYWWLDRKFQKLWCIPVVGLQWKRLGNKSQRARLLISWDTGSSWQNFYFQSVVISIDQGRNGPFWLGAQYKMCLCLGDE